MKSFYYTLFSLLLVAAFALPLQAQTYQSAGGARLGYPLSLSYKFFPGAENKAIEVYAGFRGFSFYNWISLNGAYQIHNEIEGVDNLLWYYGAGASVQFWNYDFEGDLSTVSLGISGYLGLDYAFEDTPVNVTLDWVPTFFIGDFDNRFNSFGAGYGSLGVRYIFNR